MRALLAVADPSVGAALARGLLNDGIEVAIETSFDEVRARALAERFDALVLDTVFAGGGIELCRELRWRGGAISIIMLTDADSMVDRIREREAVTDANLANPVGVSHLLAQLPAPQSPRRYGADRVVVADLLIDLGTRMVFRADRRIRLTAKEFALLRVLAQHKGQPVHRATIIAHVWNGGTAPTANALDVLARRLRRKIDQGHHQPLIRTHRSVGYRLGL